jgi:nucleoside-diphosphate-sugar epimerase
MKVLVIGGSGHIGTYLVPRLVEKGHDVRVITRGKREPYRAHAAWKHVEIVRADREDEEKRGTFGKRVRELGADTVIDLICFEPESARALVEAIRGSVQQLLVCCTVWVHGHSVQVPTVESQPRRPFGEYGVKKEAIERYILEESRRGGFPGAVIHPGHIVGPGWPPVNPAGNVNTKVFEILARGEELALPNLGLETVHHVHADDVAQVFEKAMERWSAATGESFHAVSGAALSLRGYAEAVASWFGREARLAFLPWNEWRKSVPAEDAAETWDHISHSPCASIEKAKSLLGYDPRYSSLQAVRESLDWLVDHGVVKT